MPYGVWYLDAVAKFGHIKTGSTKLSGVGVGVGVGGTFALISPGGRARLIFRRNIILFWSMTSDCSSQCVSVLSDLVSELVSQGSVRELKGVVRKFLI